MDRWRIAPLFVDFFSFSFFFFFFFEWWIAVPPDILVNQSSSDQVASEGDNVSLICAATGYPDPKITWRREDNQLINAREALVEGSTLNLADVTRQQMGAYLCIASNGVRPSVSKRILLQVEFGPELMVVGPEAQMVQRIGAPMQLHCQCRSFPLALTYWTHQTTRSSSSEKDGSTAYYTHSDVMGLTTDMYLNVELMESQDQGNYTCHCTNQLGSDNETITVSGLDPNHQRRMADFLADEEDSTTSTTSTSTTSTTSTSIPTPETTTLRSYKAAPEGRLMGVIPATSAVPTASSSSSRNGVFSSISLLLLTFLAWMTLESNRKKKTILTIALCKWTTFESYLIDIWSLTGLYIHYCNCIQFLPSSLSGLWLFDDLDLIYLIDYYTVLVRSLEKQNFDQFWLENHNFDLLKPKFWP